MELNKACSCEKSKILKTMLSNDNNIVVNKPWGFEIIWANNGLDSYIGKLLHVCPDKKLSLQYHNKKVETMICINGNGKLLLGDEINNLKEIYLSQGISCHIPEKKIHRLISNINSSVDIIEVSTNYLDDVVRLADDYKR